VRYSIEKMSPFRNDYLTKFLLVLYSDDNMSASTFKFWTTKNVAIHFKKLFCITLTTNSKIPITEDSPDETCTIEQAEFLSRRFVMRKGVIMAPLSYESLITQLYFLRSHPGATIQFLNEQLQQNLCNISRELIEWEPEKAAVLWRKIANFIIVTGIPVVMPMLNYSAGKSVHYKIQYY